MLLEMGRWRPAPPEVSRPYPDCPVLGSAALVAWHLLCDIANYTKLNQGAYNYPPSYGARPPTPEWLLTSAISI